MKNLWKALVPLLIVLAGAATAFVMIKMRKPVEPAPREKPVPIVEVVSLRRQDYRYTLRAQGTVAPPTEIRLVAEVSGQVVSADPAFTEGGFFERGDLLLEIDPRDYAVAVAQAQARLAEAQVRLQREQAEAEIARSEWERLGSGEAGPLLLRVPQLAEAGALVDSAQANLDKANLDLERCKIRAPFPGRIRTKLADLGQFLNRGESVARVYSIDYAEVRLPLALDDVAYVDLPVGYRGASSETQGPQVILTASFGPVKAQWNGRIVRTVGEIDARTRMITAVARVENPYGGDRNWESPPLAVGLFVDAEITGREVSNVFLAPRDAFRGDRDLKVVDAEGRLHFRPVERLCVEGDQVIFRGDMKDGDRVCTTLLEAATATMQVRVLGDGERRLPAETNTVNSEARGDE